MEPTTTTTTENGLVEIAEEPHGTWSTAIWLRFDLEGGLRLAEELRNQNTDRADRLAADVERSAWHIDGEYVKTVALEMNRGGRDLETLAALGYTIEQRPDAPRTWPA